MRVKGKWVNLASYKQTLRDYEKAVEERNYTKAAKIYLANPAIQEDLLRVEAEVQAALSNVA